MANPTLVQSGSASLASAASGLTVGTLSSGSVAVDDIAIAWCDAERNTVNPAGPAGWTQLGTAMVSTNSSTTIYWKRLTSGDLSSTIPFTVSATRRLAGGFVAYRGSADPVISQKAAVNSATTSLTANSMTPTVADSTLLTFYSSVSTSSPFIRTFVSYSAGWTEAVQISGTAAASSNPYTAMVSKDLTGGSGTSQTFTPATVSSASEYVEMSIVLAPSVGVYNGTTAVPGTGSLTATGSVQATTGSTLSGTGSQTATGAVGKVTGSTLAGTGTLSAGGTVGKSTGATLTGSGTLGASGGTVSAFTGGSTLAGTGSVTATGSVGKSSGASVTGTGSVGTAPLLGTTGASIVAASGTFVADGLLARFGTATLAGIGDFAVSGSLVTGTGAVLSGSGAITASGVVHNADRDITVDIVGPYWHTFPMVTPQGRVFDLVLVSTGSIELYGPIGE